MYFVQFEVGNLRNKIKYGAEHRITQEGRG